MIRPRIAFTIILYKSVPVTEKRPQRSETGIKDGFEEVEHEFPFVRPEEQDYLFRCSVAPGHFPLGQAKKSCYIYFPNAWLKLFVNSKQPT